MIQLYSKLKIGDPHPLGISVGKKQNLATWDPRKQKLVTWDFSKPKIGTDPAASQSNQIEKNFENPLQHQKKEARAKTTNNKTSKKNRPPKGTKRTANDPCTAQGRRKNAETPINELSGTTTPREHETQAEASKKHPGLRSQLASQKQVCFRGVLRSRS